MLDSGDYARLLDKALTAVGWDALQAQLKRGAQPAKWSAPASRCSSRRAGSGRSTAFASTVDTDGAVEVVTGAASVGQGVETVIAQICADALGVDYAASASSTARPTVSTSGMGAFASRVTVMTRRGHAACRDEAARTRRSTPPPN